MKNIETRKTIALLFAGAFVVLVCYCTAVDKTLPNEFVAMVSMVLGYYFGKSTALEKAKKDGE